MTIQIDEKNRINVHSDHYALSKSKDKDGVTVWNEYAWHTSMEFAIKSLAQREVASEDIFVDFDGFVERYKHVIDRITNITTTIPFLYT